MSRQIIRRGIKQGKHTTISADLDGVLEELGHERSVFLEQAAWAQLFREYDEDVVMDALEQVQDGLDDDERLQRPVLIEA